jgi:predicted Abi (CAAX) family protease
VVKAFLRHGASALVLRTNQVGGEHPQIAPVAPITF